MEQDRCYHPVGARPDFATAWVSAVKFFVTSNVLCQGSHSGGKQLSECLFNTGPFLKLFCVGFLHTVRYTQAGEEILQAFVAPNKLSALVLNRHKCLQNVRWELTGDRI